MNPKPNMQTKHRPTQQNEKITCMQQNKHKNSTETKAKNPKGNMHVRKEKPENHKLTSNVTKHTSKQHQTEPKLSWSVSAKMKTKNTQTEE